MTLLMSRPAVAGAILGTLLMLASILCQEPGPKPQPEPSFAPIGSWSGLKHVSEEVRTHVAQLHAQIAARLPDCHLKHVKPLVYRQSEKQYLVKLEIDLEDDEDEEFYARIKYEADGDEEPSLLLIDNTVGEDEPLDDFLLSNIRPCNEGDYSDGDEEEDFDQVF